jgi:hypothetical protein
MNFNKIEPIENRKFRAAFILKPGFNFHALRSHCQRIVFATDGVMTDLDQICSQLSMSFEDFDPEKDCIVPVGTAISNLLAGTILALKFPDSSITVAIYNRENRVDGRDGDPTDYIFYDVPIMSFVLPKIGE